MLLPAIPGLLLLLGAALALADRLPPPLIPWVVVPAVLWAPGQGFARAFYRDRLQRAIAGLYGSAILAALSVMIAHGTGLGNAGILAGLLTFQVTGHCLRPLPAAPANHAWRRGRWSLLLLLPLIWGWRESISRPLDGYWWSERAEEDWEGNLPNVGTGWLLNQPREGGGRWLQARRADPVLTGPFDGTLLILLRGPVGASLRVGQQQIRIERDVTVNLEEGPVARYMDRGVATLTLEKHLDRGEALPFWLSDPHQSQIYLLPNPESLWGLHETGELRFVHYYQLLNMVEQLRWARELLNNRTVTDVQPPAWSYILAGPLTIGQPDLPVTQVTLIGCLVLGILNGLRYLFAWSRERRISGVARLLPVAVAGVHLKLMVEPGSSPLPDSLFAVTAVGALAGLAAGGFVPMTLLTQLLRYPGTLLTGIGAVLAGKYREALKALALVTLVAALFGLYGLLTKQLSGWLATVFWETGPEHWHGESDPAVLLARIPEFYRLWLSYAGGTPILAALSLLLTWKNRRSLAWRGSWVALGTAFFYSFLLCTIDHFPSHYFLPLLWLSGLSLASGSAVSGHPVPRFALPFLGLMGLWISYSSVPVS